MATRKLVLKALTGSYNYNLNTPESDKDYKLFLCPTFDDLYKGKFYTKDSIITPTEDNSFHDIRKLGELLWKSNLNFLEVLYSSDYRIIDAPELTEIYLKRKDIVRMNLPYMYKACKGMHFEKMKGLLKGTETTKALVEKYGYDTKQATHAIRVMDFVIRLHKYDFDFKRAMRYNEEERLDYLAIKYGEFTLDQFQSLADSFFEEFYELEGEFTLTPTNEALKAEIEDLIMSLVKRTILEEK